MPIPGVDVNVILSSSTSAGDIPDSGRYFHVFLSDRGPTDKAVSVRSLKQWEDVFGARVAHGAGWDDARVFFDQGGSEIVGARVVGPAAAKATGSIASVVRFDASSAGAWATGWQVVIATGSISGFKVSVTDANGVVQESQDNLADTDAVVAATWTFIVPTKLGATALSAQTVTLAGGSDDRASVTGTHVAAALSLFTADFGTGAVGVPAYTPSTVVGSSTLAASLAAHCAQFDRIALLALGAGATTTDADNAAISARTAAGGNAHHVSGIFHPNIKVVDNGLTRIVSPCGFIAAKRAVAHRINNGPNVAAAGAFGAAASGVIVGVETAYDEATNASENAKGVNIIRLVDGVPTIYGYRSLSTVNRWQMLNVCDLRNTVVAAVRKMGRKRVFRTIDGQGKLLSTWKNEVRGYLQSLVDAGQVFPALDDKGYLVDVGPGVNTPQTLANNEIRLAASFRPSPTAEHVQADITVALVNGPL